MVVYSKILKKIILPIADQIMNTKLMFYYHKIQKMRFWSNGEIESWQNEKLQNLIKHAYQNTIYYKELFDKNNILSSDIKTKEDLKKIPGLTKKLVFENFEKLVPTNISEIKYKASSTGGSTGDPMKYLLDNNSWSFSNANNILNWERTSYNYGDSFLSLGSSSINVNEKRSLKHFIYYSLKNKIVLSGINMSDEVCKTYLGKINRKRIRYIYGYASAIYLLAKYAKDNNVKTSIKACFTTSEILTSLYRETIQVSFQCDVINCYGANDGGITAFEHELGFFEVGYNCIVRTNSNNSNESGGEALLTDLLNYAMPLINYKLGDELKFDEDKNEKHEYNGQIINNVLGRTSDVIKMENGNILTGPGFTVLFTDMPVIGYSLKKIGVNEIECSIQPNDFYNKSHEDTIIESLRRQSGKGSLIRIKYVKEFDLLKSGKKQYFITK